MSATAQNYEIIDDRDKVEYDCFWMIRENEYFLDNSGELYVKLDSNCYYLDPHYHEISGMCNAFCLNDNKLAEFNDNEKVTRLENVTIRYK